MITRQKSSKAFETAKNIFPGGVNSPVRAYGSVGGEPPFIARAQGAYVQDVDGNKYIDYVASWGPAILGHAHPEVIEAVTRAAQNGFSFGAPSEGENKLGQAIRALYPSMEMMRLVSSGTEACMAAIRVARAFTGREIILKFTGCYHGHADMLLVKSGSGALTFGLPDSPGVPEGATRTTLCAPYNDINAVRQVFQENRGKIAAVILEPIVGNAGFIRPLPGFLQDLRKVCADDGTLLIFDEVMTGLRVHPGGVQALAGIVPDLTTLGKVIGGGMPLAAYGGRRDIMQLLAPSGPVYQAGTLSGNPVAVACGLKTVELMQRAGAFENLTRMTTRLVDGLRDAAAKRGLPFCADSEGGMFGFFFHPGPVRSLEEAKQCNIERFKKFFHGMLERGIYLAPSAYEAGFVSMAHTDQEIDRTLDAAAMVMQTL